MQQVQRPEGGAVWFRDGSAYDFTSGEWLELLSPWHLDELVDLGCDVRTVSDPEPEPEPEPVVVPLPTSQARAGDLLVAPAPPAVTARPRRPRARRLQIEPPVAPAQEPRREPVSDEQIEQPAVAHSDVVPVAPVALEVAPDPREPARPAPLPDPVPLEVEQPPVATVEPLVVPALDLEVEQPVEPVSDVPLEPHTDLIVEAT